MVSALSDHFLAQCPWKTQVTARGKVSGWQQGQQTWPMARSTGAFYPEIASPALRLGPPTLCDSTTVLLTSYEVELKSGLI